ncbi:glycosylated lysosomal membrane protein B-like [Cydia pomonella]|uniref:glycosylated lysosomal membrane protein B-like n=1 Tax=Cydia pomonella TaxID=82600 RepID=UPI002ADD5E0C|nr:glycosylated lysosomal membrane protein B-like [Cydia pomonella]
MHLRTLVLISVLSLAFGQDRKITPTLNPDCNACSSNTTLVYIKAEGSHDTIHQLWDFTQGTPTIIYAVAGVNSSLQVKWAHDRPVKFNMSEDPSYSFAMAISDIYEYNDLEDRGHPNSSTKFRAFPLKELTWARQDSVFTEQEAMLVMEADKYSRNRNGTVAIKVRGHPNSSTTFRSFPLKELTWARQDSVFTEQEAMLVMEADKYSRDRNGTVAIKLDLLPFRDYAVQLPHLIHTANSTLVDVQLANLTQSRDFNSSRFALRLILVASDADGTMSRRVVKSLDDEHTPGVFEIIEIKTPRCASTGAGGYMQFRPVAYIQKERSVTSSTVVHLSDFNSLNIQPLGDLVTYHSVDKTPRCVITGAGGYMQFRPVAYIQKERSVTSSTVVHLSDFNSLNIQPLGDLVTYHSVDKTPRCVITGAGGYMQFRPVAYIQKERSVTSSTVVHLSDFNSLNIQPLGDLVTYHSVDKTPRCVITGAGGYMQFRPVAYIQKERSVTSSTVVHLSDFNSTYIVPPSTLTRFYPNIDEMLIEDMIVSFGEPQDGFYRQHNYTAWSTTFGYGAPPVETFSLFVILVITIGLSVPILLALSGVLYVVARRCRLGNGPTRLREE